MLKSTFFTLVVAGVALELSPNASSLVQPESQSKKNVLEEKIYKEKEKHYFKDDRDAMYKATIKNGEVKVFANPRQQFWVLDPHFEKGHENDNPGVGGVLDHVFRAQFLDRQYRLKALSFVALINVISFVCVMIASGKEGSIRNDFYHGQAIASAILIFRVMLNVNLKANLTPVPSTDGTKDKDERDEKDPKTYHKIDQMPDMTLSQIRKNLPNMLYDPKGDVYGQEQKEWSIVAGSISEFLLRSPEIAWCFIFDACVNLVGDLLRADIQSDQLPAIDSNTIWTVWWVANPISWIGVDSGQLPPIDFKTVWPFLSVAKAIGWIGVVLSTHWHREKHTPTTLLALSAALGQTFCVERVHWTSFWVSYFETAAAAAVTYLVMCGAEGWITKKISNMYGNETVPKSVQHCLGYVSAWPWEWTTAVAVYLLFFNEILVGFLCHFIDSFSLGTKEASFDL